MTHYCLDMSGACLDMSGACLDILARVQSIVTSFVNMSVGGSGVQEEFVRKYGNLLQNPTDLKSSRFQYEQGFNNPIPTGGGLCEGSCGGGGVRPLSSVPFPKSTTRKRSKKTTVKTVSFKGGKKSANKVKKTGGQKKPKPKAKVQKKKKGNQALIGRVLNLLLKNA